MTATEPQNEPVPVRDWWVMIGMLISATSAAVASFSGLYGLASEAGWPVRLAWLLPVTVDAYAMTSARVWLANTTKSRRTTPLVRACSSSPGPLSSSGALALGVDSLNVVAAAAIACHSLVTL